MWGFHDWGWGVAMLFWMLFVWTVVLLTVWIIFRNLGGPRHHLRH